MSAGLGQNRPVLGVANRAGLPDRVLGVSGEEVLGEGCETAEEEGGQRYP